MNTPRLQFLISACGGGIQKIAELSHPVMAGIEYIVSWQQPDMRNIPDALAVRSDFKIFPTDSKGLGANRRDALKYASAPIVVISDDDLSYTSENINAILEAFERNPDYSFLTFKHDGDENECIYPDSEFDFKKPPKGYFPTSFEIAINRECILQKDGSLSALDFNPHFGVNSDFCAGEEDVMLARLQRHGHQGRFIPVSIVRHDGPTTGSYRALDPEFLECKGAVMSYIHPLTWPLRMFTHALRSTRVFNPILYCRLWISGIIRARRMRVFDVSTSKHIDRYDPSR
ncbi:MAG: glycosyltransferase [Clostridium sp.]|nr:glycosyltransferase [Prevotella sp.]MCM1429566.1 glycosyltransferase [Clostridium sp.]MCM1476027.1 glycosyltransferase [Muribaculaceae bacterium]